MVACFEQAMDSRWWWRLAKRTDRSQVVQEVLDCENSEGELGVEAGLEAEGPVVPGVEGSPVSSPNCWRNCAS